MPEKETCFRGRGRFEERPHLPGRVSARFFYLDDKGPQISQKLGAETGLLVCQIKDSDWVQKAFLFICYVHVDSF
jgi:hypothetical protein